jgi:CheY-like chemotaxis protein
VLLDTARQKGFKGVVALDAESALQLAHALKPDAITLDIDLPGVDGWTVLDRLKGHYATRHIPVHVITGEEEPRVGLRRGAISYLQKPVDREALVDAFGQISSFIAERVRRLLVVEDDEIQGAGIEELLGHDDIEIVLVRTADEAWRELQAGSFQCMVLDLRLGEDDGFDLLERLQSDPELSSLPVIVHTARDLPPEEEKRLRRYAETIIIKDARSPERLLAETALFLHRVEADLPPSKRAILADFHGPEVVFEGKRVLIADDDVRNVFALTSLLESRGMTVDFAEDGQEALDKIFEDPTAFDLVLMDIMMPRMDGYDATRAIRARSDLASLPIIAVTAKAMKQDRERCLDAGASDYVTKPVDPDQLLSLMRVWLYK